MPRNLVPALLAFLLVPATGIALRAYVSPGEFLQTFGSETLEETENASSSSTSSTSSSSSTSFWIPSLPASPAPATPPPTGGRRRIGVPAQSSSVVSIAPQPVAAPSSAPLAVPRSSARISSAAVAVPLVYPSSSSTAPQAVFAPAAPVVRSSAEATILVAPTVPVAVVSSAAMSQSSLSATAPLPVAPASSAQAAVAVPVATSSVQTTEASSDAPAPVQTVSLVARMPASSAAPAVWLQTGAIVADTDVSSAHRVTEVTVISFPPIGGESSFHAAAPTVMPAPSLPAAIAPAELPIAYQTPSTPDLPHAGVDIFAALAVVCIAISMLLRRYGMPWRSH